MKSLLIFLVFTIFIEKSFQKLIFEKFDDVRLPNVPDKNRKIQTRIFGGKPARPKQFPYQVGIFIYQLPKVRGSNPGSWCGGTLISNQHVLTAAHCFYFLKNDNSYYLGNSAKIYLGTLNKKNREEEGQRRIKVPPRNWIIHGKFDRVTQHNDIALIRLPKRIEFNDYVRPASLPKYSVNERYLEGTEVIASGWGQTNDDENSGSNILRYMNAHIVPGKECQVFKNFAPQSQICLNSYGKSTCQGDSGGPHVVNEGGRHTVIGITSYGNKNGCTKGIAEVLTRVTYYLDWIQLNTGI